MFPDTKPPYEIGIEIVSRLYSLHIEFLIKAPLCAIDFSNKHS
jgi:hypothetical protein